MPPAIQGAIAFIEMQIDSLEAQIETLKQARRSLGFVDPAAPVLPAPPEPAPVPPPETPEEEPASPKRLSRPHVDAQRIPRVLDHVAGLLADGSMRIGLLELHTGMDRRDLAPLLRADPRFVLRGEKSLAEWHLVGVTGNAPPAEPIPGTPSTSAAR